MVKARFTCDAIDLKRYAKSVIDDFIHDNNRYSNRFRKSVSLS